MTQILIVLVCLFVGLLLIFIAFINPKQKKINENNRIEKQKEKEKKEEEISNWINEYNLFIKEKFGDETSKKIINENEWLGMKELELIAMYGDPNNVEENKTKDKIRRVFSYSLTNPNTGRITMNKFTFDNDILVKIDVKINQRKVWEGGINGKLKYPKNLI